MNREALAALQFEMVDQECYLGVVAAATRLCADDMADELRASGDFGSIGCLDGRFGLNYYAVPIFGGL